MWTISYSSREISIKYLASVLLDIHVTSLGVSAEEVERERSGEVEAESVENSQLHLPDLPGGVGVVRDVDEVVDLWSVHLLHLAGDEHGRDSNQLQLVASDGVAFGLHELVNDVDG